MICDVWSCHYEKASRKSCQNFTFVTTASFLTGIKRLNVILCDSKAVKSVKRSFLLQLRPHFWSSTPNDKTRNTCTYSMWLMCCQRRYISLICSILQVSSLFCWFKRSRDRLCINITTLTSPHTWICWHFPSTPDEWTLLNNSHQTSAKGVAVIEEFHCIWIENPVESYHCLVFTQYVLHYTIYETPSHRFYTQCFITLLILCVYICIW